MKANPYSRPLEADMEFPTEQTLPARFQRGLAVAPDRTALRHGEEAWTYR